MITTHDNAPAPVYLHEPGVVCNIGDNKTAVATHLFGGGNRQDLFRPDHPITNAAPILVGAVQSELPDIEPAQFNTRNNRLLAAAVQQIMPQIESLYSQFNRERIGVVMGTSTSGISDGEPAFSSYIANGTLPDDYRYEKQEAVSPARYLARSLGLQGPVYVVSSACTSGAKALASAARLIRLGVCDAVIAGGVDTLCRMTVEGFSSLSVTSSGLCNPFSKNRDGINIGEAAAVFVVSRQHSEVILAGCGETSDAHHISSPEPNGRGAESAMRKALANARLSESDVHYLNFHGTGTAQNDSAEALATHRVFGKSIFCGSSKGLTGHTLGAAGALEAAFCWLTLQREDGVLPRHCWDGEYDSELPALANLGAGVAPGAVRFAMSNSFAFGGSNISLILARDE